MFLSGVDLDHDLSTLASPVAGIIVMGHHAQLFFSFFFLRWGSG
jgi:hypothetical protein